MIEKSRVWKNHKDVTGRILVYGACDPGPERFRKKMREY